MPSARSAALGKEFYRKMKSKRIVAKKFKIKIRIQKNPLFHAVLIQIKITTIHISCFMILCKKSIISCVSKLNSIYINKFVFITCLTKFY